MARSERQKLKLLYLVRLLEAESDQSHPVTDVYKRQGWLCGGGSQRHHRKLYGDQRVFDGQGLSLIHISIFERPATGKGGQRLAAQNHGLSLGQLPEPPEVSGDGNQQFAVPANAPIRGYIYNTLHSAPQMATGMVSSNGAYS